MLTGVEREPFSNCFASAVRTGVPDGEIDLVVVDVEVELGVVVDVDVECGVLDDFEVGLGVVIGLEEVVAELEVDLGVVVIDGEVLGGDSSSRSTLMLSSLVVLDVVLMVELVGEEMLLVVDSGLVPPVLPGINLSTEVSTFAISSLSPANSSTVA